jgi:hypothetical protein
MECPTWLESGLVAWRRLSTSLASRLMSHVPRSRQAEGSCADLVLASGGPFGWIMAVTGESPGRFLDVSERPGCRPSGEWCGHAGWSVRAIVDRRGPRRCRAALGAVGRARPSRRGTAAAAACRPAPMGGPTAGQTVPATVAMNRSSPRKASTGTSSAGNRLATSGGNAFHNVACGSDSRGAPPTSSTWKLQRCHSTMNSTRALMFPQLRGYFSHNFLRSK